MDNTRYIITIHNKGYISYKETEYTGTVKELVDIHDINRCLKGKKPRQINTLMKALDDYAKEHSTLYTYISFNYRLA